MQLNGKRSYGKIASLPPEVRNAVDNMILTCTVRLPEIQAYIPSVKTATSGSQTSTAFPPMK